MFLGNRKLLDIEMDNMGEKGKYGMDEKKEENNHMSYSPSDWRFDGPNSSMGLVGPGNSMALVIGSSSAPMAAADSFVPAPWDHSQNMGFCGALGMLKGGLFASSLPADSAFIERAARFSSFNSAADIVNPFTGPESVGLYSRPAQGSPLKSGENEAKRAENENESDGAEFSGGRDEEASVNGIIRGGSRKRKRNIGQDSGQQAKGTSHEDDNTEHNKTGAKNGKQASDPGKEDYIHVRARRGQATNSHSLAERVRREKISERMKFLQDLVPGCNKVTGKAVMLDEIINYVQSLQRQVEFLSMKLATVNPRLDFSLESLLGKDMLQPRVIGGSLSSLSFGPMAYSSLQPPQQGLVHPGIGSASDILRRTINSQLTPLPLGFKEPPQLANVWEDELNNVVQMSFGARTCPSSSQEADGSVPDGQMKVEL